jgi:transposase InsO family protein
VIAGEAWERIGVVFIGPHPRLYNGHIYIMTGIDHFTKWVELSPMRDQEAATVAKLLIDRTICVQGCPIQILTDQGANFESELFRGLCKRLQMDKIRTTAYRPQTNGNIDRFHATMYGMFAKRVADNQIL